MTWLPLQSQLQCQLILSALVLCAVGLSGCGREEYTTWTCKDESGAKSTMILKKAQMQFQNQQFDYCGSLGNYSYFNQQCQVDIQASSQILAPSTGKLMSSGQAFDCNAL